MADNPYAKYANPYAGYVPIGVPDPAKPIDLKSKQLGVQKSEAELALTPYQLRKQKADAAKAELDLKTAQEQYQAQHPDVSTNGLYGDDYLKTLPQSEQHIIKALAEGRLAFPSGAGMRSPAWMQKLQEVAQYDPTFDATNFNSRAQARINAIKGKLGQSNNALNTAIGHLGLLQSQIGGTYSTGGYPFATSFNHVANSLSERYGSAGVTNFKDTASKLADELEAVYRNGGGAEAGVVRQLRNLDVDASAEQKRGIVANAMDLLASKMAANISQYNFGTGGKPTWDMLDEHTRDVLNAPQFQHIRDKYFAAPANGNNPPPTNPPPSGSLTPPTGPTDGGFGASTNGYSETPDPQSAQFWADAASQQMPYRTALSQWQSDVKARGLVGQAPPPPGAYHKAAAFIRDHPDVPYQPFSAITRKPTDPIQQAVTDAAFSGPGVALGHTANSLAANIPTALAGDQGAQYNAVSNAMHPNYALAGDVAGTTAGAIGAGAALKGVAPSLGRFGSFLTANPARTALTGDSLFFGGSGAAQNPDHPFIGAGVGVAAGAAGNALGRYVLGPGIAAAADSPLVQRGVNAARGMFGRDPISPPPALDPGQNLLFNRASGNPLDGIQNNLQDAANLNLPYSLADADPRLSALVGSSVRKSPDVLALANQTLAPRQLGQAERALAQIDTHLAPSGDVASIKADARTRAQNATANLYQKAFTHPVPDDPKILEMLDTPAGQQAARNAYAIALNRGENPAELSFATGPDGLPIINARPNWKTLQYIKMGFDKVITDNKNPITGNLDLSDPANQALNTLRANFVGRLGELNPDYAKANAEYGRIIGQGTAAEHGYNAAASKVTPSRVQEALANNAQNLPQYRQGYASSMADAVNNTQFSGDPYNRIFGTPNQQTKVNMIFPNAHQFSRARSLENDMSRTYTEALGGSQTQPRAEADKLFDSPAMDAGLDMAGMALAGMPPVNIAKRGLKSILTNGGLGLRNSKAKADALGPLLLGTDPNANIILLNSIINSGQARRAYLQSIGAAGGQAGAGMFGAPILYGLSQQ